jgi:integrase
MARVSIDKATVRAKLEPRREPYWGAPIAQGLFVGFRRTESGGTWIARLMGDDKKHRYQSIGAVSPVLDYEMARKSALEWRRQMHAGVDTNEVKTVADACRAYVEDRQITKGAKSATDAEQRFKRTVYSDPIGALSLAKVTQRHVEKWRNALSEPRDGRNGLAPASMNRTLTALKAALNFAVTHRYLAADRTIEWSLVKPMKASNRRDLFLDLVQRRALLAQLEGDAHDFIGAAALTGARGGELASIQRKHFDPRTGTVTLDGKTGPRAVPLAPAAVDLFKRAGRDKLPEAWLFTNGGKQWDRWAWNEAVHEAAKVAGLPDGVVLYTLRHSFITEAITAGMSLLDVARLVGTSLAMIDKHYGHLVQDAARKRLAALSMI